MRALIRLFKKRWFISLLGLLLIAVLIWYAGPQFSFAGWAPWASEHSRVVTILMIFGAWGLYRLLRYLQARAISTKVIAAMLGRSSESSASRTPQPADEEVAVLEQHIQEAVAVLKKGKESRWPGSQFLYQLPWYVLIGPPGSGKTTALTTASLRFLVTDEKGQGQELRGVHGTRDCDWFFTDQAVLLDNWSVSACRILQPGRRQRISANPRQSACAFGNCTSTSVFVFPSICYSPNAIFWPDLQSFSMISAKRAGNRSGG
jgi:type VI secretion system protein ImpL